MLLGVPIAHIMGSPSINNISWISERENKSVSLLVSASVVCLSLPPTPSYLSFFASGTGRKVNIGRILSVSLVLLNEALVCFSEPEGFPLS